MRFGLRFVVAFAFAGCRRDPLPTPTLEIAEPVGVAGAEKITCRVGPKQTTLSLDDAGLHVRFVTARGNTVTMFGQDVIAGAPADTALERRRGVRGWARWPRLDRRRSEGRVARWSEDGGEGLVSHRRCDEQATRERARQTAALSR